MSPSSYHSDDSEYTRRSRRHHRPARSADHLPRRAPPRRTGSAPTPNEKSSSTAANMGKLALGVVFVQLVSTCLSTWMRKKEEESEMEYQRDRRREFERAKAKRRREEERWERELEDRERAAEDARWEREVIITEGKRIAPARSEVSEEHASAVRRIEAPPEWDGRSERATSRSGEGKRARSRGGRSEKARSRAAPSEGYSSEEEDERRRYTRRPGRSRSRPAVDVS